MSAPTPHLQDLIAASVLDAVTAAEAALVTEHLAGCALCRGLQRELREAAILLPELAGEIAPPPALRARLMAIVEDEARGGPAPRALPRPILPAARPGLPRVLAVAAAVALLVAGAGTWRLYNEATRPRPTSVYSLQGTTTQPAVAGALAYVAGERRADLVLHGLRPLPPGRVYELWMIRGAFAAVRGVGVFRPAADGSGHLSLTGLRVPSYNMIGLTVEQAPRSAVPHPPLVASGKITG
ncbi:MAG: hypothetical protein NVSMB65_18250 [Chloroflexota bacterium]